jgi:hypothetical protein
VNAPADSVLGPLLEARLLLREPTPGNIDRCAPLFAAAAGNLRQLLESSGGPGPLADAIFEQVAAVSRLLEQAAEFRREVFQGQVAESQRVAVEGGSAVELGT